MFIVVMNGPHDTHAKSVIIEPFFRGNTTRREQFLLLWESMSSPAFNYVLNRIH